MEKVRDIECKSDNDTYRCCIVEAALVSRDKLLVTDFCVKNTLKLIDIEQNKIHCELDLSEMTYCVCNISDTQVAVTVPFGQKIVILNLYKRVTRASRGKQTLRIEKEIQFRNRPWGIGHVDGKLVVSFVGHNKIEIIDMRGNVMNIFRLDIDGNFIFDHPYHLAIHPENKCIYVSNHDSHSVVCITMDGTVMATYKDDDLEAPAQITFDSNGNVYICGERSHNVHQITQDCQKIRVILTRQDGLEAPSAISYNEDERLFYIGQRSHNNVQVYKAATL